MEGDGGISELALNAADCSENTDQEPVSSQTHGVFDSVRRIICDLFGRLINYTGAASYRTRKDSNN